MTIKDKIDKFLSNLYGKKKIAEEQPDQSSSEVSKETVKLDQKPPDLESKEEKYEDKLQEDVDQKEESKEKTGIKYSKPREGYDPPEGSMFVLYTLSNGDKTETIWAEDKIDILFEYFKNKGWAISEIISRNPENIKRSSIVKKAQEKGTEDAAFDYLVELVKSGKKIDEAVQQTKSVFFKEAKVKKESGLLKLSELIRIEKTSKMIGELVTAGVKFNIGPSDYIEYVYDVYKRTGIKDLEGISIKI